MTGNERVSIVLERLRVTYYLLIAERGKGTSSVERSDGAGLHMTPQAEQLTKHYDGFTDTAVELGCWDEHCAKFQLAFAHDAFDVLINTAR